MKVTSEQFKKNAYTAIHDIQLQSALEKMQQGAVVRRAETVAALPEFQALREKAKQIKNHTLKHLEYYLTLYEKNVINSGGHVHWARNDEEARQIVLQLCQQDNGKIVTKGKSMLSEEIALNDYLEGHGLTIVETDLGEYILQIRGESPTHIVTPAIHVNQEQVTADFHRVHTQFPKQRNLEEAESLLNEAREVLRQQFFAADIGITGANFLLADSGSSIIVTNEGNGDLTQTLAKKHIVLAGIDKVLPSFADAGVMLRLLGRSATGQEMTTYTTVSTGARRENDVDGPGEYHVVLVDNGRSALLGTEFQPMLRCIRCAACMNHCPVYQAVGGKTYGWVYPGPMGAVLTPMLVGLDKAGNLPNASTFCGKCVDVCPVKIPLTDLMRFHRNDEFKQKLTPTRVRLALKMWTWIATRPRLYRFFSRIMATMLHKMAGKKNNLRYLPFASAWTKYRDFPAPQGKTFMQQYKRERK